MAAGRIGRTLASYRCTSLGRRAWVIQAGPGWSSTHLERDPAEIAPLLLHALAARLGACGDWLLGPRVEAAWLSGARLAEAFSA